MPNIEVSVILIDWNVRESFHILEYLNDQVMPRDRYELIWVEYFDYLKEKKALLFRLGADRVICLNKNGQRHQAACFNAGILEARGEVVVLPDSDCVVNRSFVSSIARFFREDRDAVLFLDRRVNDDPTWYPFPAGAADYAPESFPSVNIVFNGSMPVGKKNHGGCICALRDHIVAVHGYDEDGIFSGFSCTGADIAFRLFNTGLREVWHDAEFLIHPWHPQTHTPANEKSRRYLNKVIKGEHAILPQKSRIAEALSCGKVRNRILVDCFSLESEPKTYSGELVSPETCPGCAGPESIRRLNEVRERWPLVAWRIDWALKQCLRLLPAGARILDMGCGGSSLPVRLARAGYEVTGVDVEEMEYERGVTFLKEDFSQPTSLSPESFDAVVATGTILGIGVGERNVAERVSYFRRIHTQVERVLRPGGFYILTLPVSQGSFRQILFEGVTGRDLPEDVPTPEECVALWQPYLQSIDPKESLKLFGCDELRKDYTEIGLVLWKKNRVPLSRIAGKEDPYVCGGYKQSVESLTRFYKRLGRRLNKSSGRLLDVGCGDGKVSQALSRAGYQVYGVDRSAIGIALAQNRVKEGRFLAADLLREKDLMLKNGFSHFEVILARQFSLLSVPDLADNDRAIRTLRLLLELLDQKGIIVVQHASNLIDLQSRDGTFYYHSPDKVKGLVGQVSGCTLVDMFHVVPDENLRVSDITEVDPDCNIPCLVWVVTKEEHYERP